MDRKSIYFILTEIFEYNRSHEKRVRKFFHPITIAYEFLTRGKSVSSNQKSAVQINQSVHNALTLLLAPLYSEKFVEFPQVYSSFLANQL